MIAKLYRVCCSLVDSANVVLPYELLLYLWGLRPSLFSDLPNKHKKKTNKNRSSHFGDVLLQIQTQDKDEKIFKNI